MTARFIGLVTAAAVAGSAFLGRVTPASLGRVTPASAATAQVFVTGYALQGYTASGTYVHPGTCAVDPRVIPLGSYVTIQGLVTCHAEDTGGAIIGYRIDMWVPTVAQANAITGWYSASWGQSPSQHVPGVRASQPRLPVLTPRRAPHRQPGSGHVNSWRWYSHGNAYFHHDT